MQQNNAGQITQDLKSWFNGNQQAGVRIFHNAYNRLVSIASSQRRNIGEITLTPNDIVHEAYSRLIQAMDSSRPQTSLEFYRLSARIFRLTCVDYLRTKLAQKRDAKSTNVEVQTYASDDRNLLQILMLLQEFENKCKRQATAFELNKVIGFSLGETAKLTGSSKATTSRDINFARHWLASRLDDF